MFARVTRFAWLVAATILLAASVGWAQDQAPPRPRLAADADTNDWQAYYNCGFDLIPKHPREAEAAFYWASRINPERADPLMGRWVAFHLRNPERFIKYLNEDLDAREARDVLAMDSVRLMSMVRDPFVHRGLEIVLFDKLPGVWLPDDRTRGWVAYSEAHLDTAVTLLGRAIQRDPRRNLWLRTMRAQAFVAMQQVDSAYAEMVALRTELRRQEAAKLVIVYQSKEFVDYAIGVLEEARGHEIEARDAMGEALVEDIGFYPAHLFVGDQFVDAGRLDEAVAAYEAALLTKPNDAVLYFHYGRALAAARRLPEAVAALHKAVEIEPYYATPWLFIGRLLATADHAAARVAYQNFISRAPRSDPNLTLARGWLAQMPNSP